MKEHIESLKPADFGTSRVDYPFGDKADKLYFNYKAIAEWLSRQ